MNRRHFVLSSAIALLHGACSSALARASQSGAPAPDPALRTRLMQDPLRPQFHMLPQGGLVGDPCAPRFFDGRYHLFYHGSFGGGGWHHAMSSDLLHWSHLPIALTRTPGTADAYGTFTGSVLPGGEGASIVYTGVTKVPTEQETIRNEGLREVQCIATSADEELRTWHKLDHPIIDGPPPGLKVTGFRDPFAWQEGDTWYIGVGSGFSQVGGAVLLYRSHDARHWEYLHPLAEGTWNGAASSNPVPSGEMWECPDFFPLGGKHVLLYSSEHTTFWEVGDFDRQTLRFHSQRKGCLDRGDYYAPKSMLDGNGRRILWGWVQETRSREMIDAAGWGGCFSLPRVLTLGAGGELNMEVAHEFAALRLDTLTIQQPRDHAELANALSRAVIRSRAAEIVVKFKVGESSCGLDLRLGARDNSVSLLALAYDGVNEQPAIAIGDKRLPLSPDSEGFSTLHIWLDGSVIETFVDKQQVVTTRTYATGDESAGLHAVWLGATASLQSLTICNLKPISEDRLTS